MRGNNLVYSPKPIESGSNFEMLRDMVYLYSIYRKLKGEVKSPLRHSLCVLLTIYILHGYNKEVKTKAESILGVKRQAITSHNKDLRDAGYLVPDKMNSVINYLSPGLLKMKEYYTKCVEKGQDFVCFFAYTLTEGNEEGSIL